MLKAIWGLHGANIQHLELEGNSYAQLNMVLELATEVPNLRILHLDFENMGESNAEYTNISKDSLGVLRLVDSTSHYLHTLQILLDYNLTIEWNDALVTILNYLDFPQLRAFSLGGYLNRYRKDIYTFVHRHTSILEFLNISDYTKPIFSVHSAAHTSFTDKISLHHTSLALSHLTLIAHLEPLNPFYSIYISQSIPTLISLTINQLLCYDDYRNLVQLFPPRGNVLRSLSLALISLSPQLFKSLADRFANLRDLRVVGIRGVLDDVLRREEGTNAHMETHLDRYKDNSLVRNLSLNPVTER
jgi:hypothetical protein